MSSQTSGPFARGCCATRGTARRDGRAACRHRQDRAPRGVVVVLHGYAAFVIVPPVRLSTMTGLSNQVIVGLAP